MARKRVGNRLKVLRQAKGLTQVELAEKAGITQAYLAQLEAGVRGNPSLVVIQRLAQALGVRVLDLLKEL